MRVTAKNRNGVRSTQPAKTPLARFRRTSSTRPTSATSTTTSRAPIQPTVKSPATRSRYSRIESGLPSFVPPPPTPTSNRLARTVSLRQNGIPRRPTTTNAGKRLAQTSRIEDVEALRRDDQGAVWMRGDARENRQSPEHPAPAVAALEGDEQREVRERRRKEEERVHPPVDAVEEEHPARHDDRRCDERDRAIGQARNEHGDQRARWRWRRAPRRAATPRVRRRGAAMAHAKRK